jgi:hypothetical protein
MPQIAPRRVRHLLTIWVLFLGLVLSLFATGNASAAFKGCRGDPIVWFSNGVMVTMVANITADASQVKMVTYTVHAPKGLAVNQIVYTGGPLQGKERVVVLFDRASGYQVEARAELYTGVAPVTITAMWEQFRTAITTSSTYTVTFLFP